MRAGPGRRRRSRKPDAEFRAILESNLLAGFHLATCAATRSPEGERRLLSSISPRCRPGLDRADRRCELRGLQGRDPGLTRELAGQWGRRGIRVNAVVPGWFDTEMTDGLFSNENSAGWVRRNTMLGRGGRTGEIDGAVLFLASDASSYVTGQTVVVDGGWTAR